MMYTNFSDGVRRDFPSTIPTKKYVRTRLERFDRSDIIASFRKKMKEANLCISIRKPDKYSHAGTPLCHIHNLPLDYDSDGQTPDGRFDEGEHVFDCSACLDLAEKMLDQTYVEAVSTGKYDDYSTQSFRCNDSDNPDVDEDDECLNFNDLKEILFDND